jgi:hypothetical protein
MILGKDNTTSKALSFKKLKTHDATSSSGQIPEKNFTFHQQRFNSSYPSRQFPIPLKVTIALEIFTHNKPYFIHCRKKKLFAFPDLDSIHLFTCLW